MKKRIDILLVEQGYFDSRERAKKAIMAGLVFVDNQRCDKAGTEVKEDANILVKGNPIPYVSRGGLKLEKALDTFNIDFNGLKIMDIGSSTGGFCDCALKHGVKSIVAVDVGTNLMHESLRNNKQIDLHEKTNFKDFDSKYFKDIDAIVCDVSFISLKKIIDKIYLENIKVDIICLIKPQFECGKEIADKYKGIILNEDIHINIINSLLDYFNSKGFYVKNLTSSPIRGGDGNIEYLAYISNKINQNEKIDIKKLVLTSFMNKTI